MIKKWRNHFMQNILDYKYLILGAYGEKKKIKAVGLLSGGLDSTLAVKLMIDQSIDVTVLNF